MQDKAFGGQHPMHRRRGCVHQIQAGAARGELAMGSVDGRPRLEQLHDRGALGLQQAVHRPAAARHIHQPTDPRALAPHGGPVRVQAEQRTGATGRPAGTDSMIEQGEQPSLHRRLNA